MTKLSWSIAELWPICNVYMGIIFTKIAKSIGFTDHVVDKRAKILLNG